MFSRYERSIAICSRLVGCCSIFQSSVVSCSKVVGYLFGFLHANRDLIGWILRYDVVRFSSIHS